MMSGACEGAGQAKASMGPVGAPGHFSLEGARVPLAGLSSPRTHLPLRVCPHDAPITIRTGRKGPARTASRWSWSP
jgi:hypothetical protein